MTLAQSDSLEAFKKYFLTDTYNISDSIHWPCVVETYHQYLHTCCRLGLKLAKQKEFNTALKEWGYKLVHSKGKNRFNGNLKPIRQLVNKNRMLDNLQDEIIDSAYHIGPQRDWPTTTEVYNAYVKSYLYGLGGNKMSRKEFSYHLREVLGHIEVPAYGAFRVNAIILQAPKGQPVIE
jgi:hypothetical protein